MDKALHLKKEQKKQKLLGAAYTLFTEKGVGKTSVDDIVRAAEVAKGTFYLYFKDKEALQQQLIFNICGQVLGAAYRSMDANRTNDFVENVVLIIDYVIEYFKKNHLALRMIERNFSWPMVTQQLSEGTDPLWQKIVGEVSQSPLGQTGDPHEVFKIFFVLIEMIGSTCYSSIIENRPAPIDSMKPILYEIVRRALR